MMINMEKIQKPFLRFQGFTDTWEQREAKELVSITTGKSNTQDQKEDGIYPFYIRSETLVKSSKYLYDEEAVITIGDGQIGKVFHYINGKFDLHQRCYKMSKFKNLTGKFFYYYFSTMFYDRAMKMTAKATVDSVRLEMISDMEIRYPKNISEQTKITSLLSNLDELITFNQRKYEKLVNVKKALLDKMFPEDGEAVPKLRFKGFTDTWKQSVLGEIVPITMGQSPNGVNYTSNPEDYILVQGNADMENGKVVPRVWTTQITKLAKKNDLIFSVRAPVGSVGKTDYEAVIGRGVASIRGNEFIYQQLIKLNQSGFWKRISTGSTFDSINSTELKNISVKAPEKIEQEKIGSFLKSIDSLIFLQQRKYEKLVNIKKALLQKMFI